MEASFPAVVANLIVNELVPRLKKAGVGIEKSPVPPELITLFAALKIMGRVTTHEIRGWMDECFDSARKA